MKPGLYIISLSLTACLFSINSKGQTISGIVNSYHQVTDFVPLYNGVRLQNVSGLNAGNRVLIIQMKGATIDETQSASFGAVTGIGQAGLYEFATICGFLNDTVIFEREFINTYDYTKSVQLVYVPVYTDVTINGTLLAQEWNPATGTGGVIAIEATGTVTMNAGISADSAGYKGGGLFMNATNRCGPRSNWYYSLAQSSGTNLGGAPKGEGIAAFISNKEYGRGKQANGGGGGNVDETGGGGGSNFGAGGNGGQKSNTTFCNSTTYGQGGATLSSFGYTAGNNRIFFGGGGGCGEMNNYYDGVNPPGAGTPGGDGGGIVFIKCNQLIGNNQTISANGAQGVNPFQIVKTEGSGDGGGGGGAGGVVLLDVATYTTSLNVQARGANGSSVGFQNACPGPGGGGGGGVIWYSGTLPGTVITNVTAGASGVIKNAPSHNPPCEGLPNGAAAGTNGIVQSGFQIVEGTLFNCGGILPFGSLKNWMGKRTPEGVQLSWTIEQADALQEIALEKKQARGGFVTIKTYLQPQNGNSVFLDEGTAFPATYRLMLKLKTGAKEYAAQLFFDRQKVKRLNIYPNPVMDELRIELPAARGKIFIALFDYTGKQVMKKELDINNQSYTILQLGHLTAGTYTIRVYMNYELYIGKMVKQ